MVKSYKIAMLAKNKNLISSILLIATIVPTILFSIPKKANAIWGIFDTSAGIDAPTNVATGIAQTGTGATTAGATGATAGSSGTTAGLTLKQVATKAWEELKKAVARRLVQEMTKSIVNWINSGYHGSPLFLDNPESFFKDILKSEVKNVINMFGYDSAKFPFGRDFALNLMSSYKQTLENNASYSLSTVMSPVEASNYRNNFNYGGWNAFLVNTQYPQNNYIGFQMMATEEIARRVGGTVQTGVQKVQTALQQGGGFLSPQTCKTNPDYNNGTNEWKKPSFDPSSVPTPDPTMCEYADDDNPTPDEKYQCEQSKNKYEEDLKTAKDKWAKKNTCPGGLQSTTPGSVVGNMVSKALGGPQDQASYSAMVGNATSAIMDALLNKYIGEGLTSLASRINKKKDTTDTWTYEGQSLGVDNGGYGTSWDAGPDEPIDLNKFKKQLNGYYIGKCTRIEDSEGSIPDIENISEDECKAYPTSTWTKNIPTTLTANSKNSDKVVVDYVPGSIADTETEIKLMDNTDPLNPGIIQLIKMIPEQTISLDQCLPGPDKGWEKRLDDEVSQQSGKFGMSFETNPNNKVLNGVTKELKFAVNEFKNWITDQMTISLPNAIVYMDEIKKIDDLAQQSLEVTNARRAKSQTLTRLKSIAEQLDVISENTKGEQPEADSVEEKALIALVRQYKAAQISISSPTSIESTRDELNTMIDKANTLATLDQQCWNERTKAGWSPADSSGKGLGVFKFAVGKSFLRTKITTKLRWSTKDLSVGGLLSGGLPIPTTIGHYVDTLQTYSFPYIDTMVDASQDEDNPVTAASTNTKTGGTEIEQFCELPIISGYSHGDIIEETKFNRPYRNKTLTETNPDPAHGNYTFRNLNNYLGNKDDYGFDEKGRKIVADYTSIPLVNAQYVLGDKTCTGTCSISAPGSKESDERKSINIDCGTVFKANKMDYTKPDDFAY